MSIQYLVDYENVHEPGLSGMQSLSSEDTVYIFHTSCHDRISLSTLDNVNAWVKVIPVPAGKQSLDMHLGSFLGYLIGREQNPDSRYVIISMDNDYNGIANFWNLAFGTDCKVTQALDFRRRSSSLDPIVFSSALEDFQAEKTEIRNDIIRIFSQYGVPGKNGLPCMLVSDLCNQLNTSAVYNALRRRLSKKPLQYLRDECHDILLVTRDQCQDWAYLVAGRAVCDDAPGISDTRMPEDLGAAAGDISPDAITPEDLSIGDEELLSERCADASEPLPSSDGSPAMAEESQPETPEKGNREEPPFLQIAMDLFRSGEQDPDKDENGRLRASKLRDALLACPEFRAALKASGLPPIAFLGQLFDGKISISREKGIHWASLVASPASTPGSGKESAPENPESIMDLCRKSFYDQALHVLQKQISDTGISGNIVDEIAEIFMLSRTSPEPRKAIHTLLCQHFGPHLGAKYYRQTVKFIVP